MPGDYKKLEVWNLGYELVLRLYDATEKFPESEKGNITSQIRRAATSIPLNIAEGSSRTTKNAYLQFLNYAYGSARELEVLLLLSQDLKYLDLSNYSELNELLNKLSRKLFNFILKVDQDKFYTVYKEKFVKNFNYQN